MRTFKAQVGIDHLTNSSYDTVFQLQKLDDLIFEFFAGSAKPRELGVEIIEAGADPRCRIRTIAAVVSVVPLPKYMAAVGLAMAPGLAGSLWSKTGRSRLVELLVLARKEMFVPVGPPNKFWPSNMALAMMPPIWSRRAIKSEL